MQYSNLTVRATARLNAIFKKRNHIPSRQEESALIDLLDTLTKMAHGQAEPVYYLSDLDPGVGKSTAIASWIQELVRDKNLSEVGVLLLVERYDEIKQYLATMNLNDDSYSVLVAEGHELNNSGLGRDRTNEAQVLITTKEQFFLRTQNKEFSKVKEFMYRGKPRRVRIWDEGFLGGTPLVLERWNLGKLIAPLSDHDDLREIAQEIMDSLGNYTSGQTFDVPSLPISHSRWDRLFWDESNDVRDVARVLKVMEGRTVTVRSVQRNRNTIQVLVDAVDSIPEDFKPCLITDASGRLRYTYSLQEKYRRDLKRLKSAEKDYSNLTCYMVDIASGKNAYKAKNQFPKLVETVVEIIKSRPSDHFLVIYHEMPTGDFKDLKEAVLSRIRTDTGNDRVVEFIPWGKHTASNDYREFSNTIIVGPLFYSPPQCEAIGRAASGMPTFSGEFSEEERNLVSKGEIAHNIYQAACRSSIRKNQGGKCPPANLWILSSIRTGVKGLLPKIFPGCTVKPWNNNELDKRASNVLEIIKEMLKEQSTEGDIEILFSHVWKAAGFRDGYDFYRSYSRNSSLQERIKSLGLTVEGSGRNRRFVRSL